MAPRAYNICLRGGMFYSVLHVKVDSRKCYGALTLAWRHAASCVVIEWPDVLGFLFLFIWGYFCVGACWHFRKWMLRLICFYMFSFVDSKIVGGLISFFLLSTFFNLRISYSIWMNSIWNSRFTKVYIEGETRHSLFSYMVLNVGFIMRKWGDAFV